MSSSCKICALPPLPETGGGLPAPSLTVAPPPAIAGPCTQDLLRATSPLFSMEAEPAKFEAEQLTKDTD